MCLPFLAPVGVALGASASSAAAVGTAAVAGTAASLAGAGLGAASAIQSASAQQAQARYAAQQDRTNQTLAGYEADAALQKGELEQKRQQRAAAGLKGAQRASMAARGLDLGEGSPADILTGTDLLSAEDTAIIQTNARRAAWGYRVQGANYAAQAGMYDATAKNTTGAYGAATSLLGGASQVASHWYRFGAAETP